MAHADEKILEAPSAMTSETPHRDASPLVDAARSLTSDRSIRARRSRVISAFTTAQFGTRVSQFVAQQPFVVECRRQTLGQVVGPGRIEQCGGENVGRGVRERSTSGPGAVPGVLLHVM